MTLAVTGPGLPRLHGCGYRASNFSTRADGKSDGPLFQALRKWRHERDAGKFVGKLRIVLIQRHKKMQQILEV
ncbi:MAG: hypothetical protein L0H73_09855, partial [Nitrococcus sp.]|nr:hypothetical protein [Nitrococcus sp.]